ncbi:MAG: restriction endonuclease [Candidatus Marinimicrobia bacterium]|nr:restriction endonuclease [Candidatus Neomarinimicrobiota bacterium]
MTTKQYEKFVTDYFESKGFTVSQTPYSNDYGVDVFAENDKEIIAIQAKMFGKTSRKINRQMVMEFHGAKDYFDCDKGVIVTNGEIIQNAKEVADKLGIEVLFLSPSRAYTLNKKSRFDEIWKEYVMRLAGKTITRKNGETNKIVTVDWGGIERITSNGNLQKIDIEISEKTINHILKFGSITRQEINQEYSKRASSGIVLILSQLPMFRLNKSIPMSIELVE